MCVTKVVCLKIVVEDLCVCVCMMYDNVVCGSAWQFLMQRECLCCSSGNHLTKKRLLQATDIDIRYPIGYGEMALA